MIKSYSDGSAGRTRFYRFEHEGALITDKSASHLPAAKIKKPLASEAILGKALHRLVFR